MLLGWILDNSAEEGYLPSALEAAGATWKPKQFALHGVVGFAAANELSNVVAALCVQWYLMSTKQQPGR